MFQRIVRSKSCAFCAFAWAALTQCPPTNTWPPVGDEEVTIRVRTPWANCCQLGVVSSASSEEEFQLRGRKYVSQSRNVQSMESEVEVYTGLASSHEVPVDLVASDKKSMVAKVQQSSGSEEALQLAKIWLQNCQENHPSYSELSSNAKKPPIRLINLQGPDSSRVYLCDIDQIQDEYVALSYCWGPGSPGLFTTTNNVQSHRDDGVAIKDLPRTIRDAIHATTKLGLRYLWVDRLCILQDSTTD
ncbi:hypothetical protein ACHAPT_009024 [Fusarium lateritium]